MCRNYSTIQFGICIEIRTGGLVCANRMTGRVGRITITGVARMNRLVNVDRQKAEGNQHQEYAGLKSVRERSFIYNSP